MAISVIPDPGVISFSRGVPSPDMFPVEQLADCARAAVLEHGRMALNYGRAGGYAPLREWVAARHGVTRRTGAGDAGLADRPEPVVRPVCAGRQAIVEAPTYDRMLHALADAGATVVTVGARRRRPRPGPARASWPPPARRRRCSTCCRRSTTRPAARSTAHSAGRWSSWRWRTICRCSRTTRTACCASRATRSRRCSRCCAAQAGRTSRIFASSFSKSVAPGLRVGYLVLPEHLVAPLAWAIARTYVSPPLLAQAQLQLFLTRAPRAAPRGPGGVPAAAPRRAARAPSPGAGRVHLDAPGRRLLPLARAARAPRRRPSSNDRAARGRRHVRAGRRVLRRPPAPVERARLQLPSVARSARAPAPGRADPGCDLTRLDDVHQDQQADEHDLRAVDDDAEPGAPVAARGVGEDSASRGTSRGSPTARAGDRARTARRSQPSPTDRTCRSSEAATGPGRAAPRRARC